METKAGHKPEPFDRVRVERATGPAGLALCRWNPNRCLAGDPLGSRLRNMK
jgi:hypothetical protein